ncbi:methyltransferase domain-containing protein [Sphingomonas crocodyli]|uniref:Methyltransferase domain-containing protein n=1 Tax=Sphingomonas crocodyli TaxID=1979270 RepID=A0A437LVT5_9SPHN|nr:methyltransferase domain-containing protein [Sphingomonas crocodyli]RVT89495.1 methyltransferase domain-containing protein [Sphingomonas crocodyli]
MKRATQDEQMDAADIDPAEYARVLTDLAKVNWWTMATRPTLTFLDRAVADRRRFTLLDVGFGDGDMLRAIARWAAKRGIEADLIGVDLNPRSEDVARAATPADMPIRYITGDYRDHLGDVDLIVSSLVTHHMDDAERIDFLQTMERAARRGWFVNDIRRHWFPYLGFPILARLMGWHRIVREDGTLSIARGFVAREWRAMIDAAGLDPAAVSILPFFPFRLCVARLR